MNSFNCYILLPRIVLFVVSYLIAGTSPQKNISYLIAGTSPQKSIGARREKVPFSMDIENGELLHECFPKHLCMGTARRK